METVKAISDGSLALQISDVPSRPAMAVVPPPPPSGDAPFATPGGAPLAAPPPSTAPSTPASPHASPPAPPVPQPAVDASSGSEPQGSRGADGLLDDLVARFPDAHGAILASVDGFSIARSTSMADEASHPAMLAAAVGLAHQLVALGGGDQLRQLVVDHDRGLLLVWPVGDQRVLAVLADRTVDQRELRSFVQAGATVLVGGET